MSRKRVIKSKIQIRQNIRAEIIITQQPKMTVLRSCLKIPTACETYTGVSIFTVDI